MASWDPDIEIADLVVMVRNGTVTLEGTVDAYWKKVRAERQVEGLVGVVSVENKLGVVPSDEISDKLISDEIIGKLDTNVLIDPDSLNIEVENGHVRLSGTVADHAARVAAYDAALATAGVRSVANDIDIVV